MRIYPSVWGSIVNLCNRTVDDMRLVYPETPIEFIDWEAHSNIFELPETDLIGPTSLVLTELSPQMFEVSFAMAVSSFSTDRNLFRHRHYIAEIFEKLRPMEQIKIYDSETAQEVGFLKFTDGTMIAPMSRAETRPWQYVQTSGLLEPTMT